MTATEPAVGGLSAMRGQSIDLKYRADGETLERALITGDAVAQVGGERGSQDRVIGASTLDVSLAPDGSTPTALTARDNVQLTIPADKASPARSIQAPALDGQGEAGRGLTRARFTGGVRFRERGPDVDRSAQSAHAGRDARPRAERDRGCPICPERSIRGGRSPRRGGAGPVCPRQGHAGADGHRAGAHARRRS